MRKIKKINGYLVVKFNDRELREYAGTALGNYGVIDAELYTGNLDIDRGSMQYDDAGSLDEAVELARNLEAEHDINEGLASYIVVKEMEDSTVETEVDPQILREGFESELELQIKSPRYPDVNPATARHELYGYLVALKELGIIDPDGCYVEPYYFDPERERLPICDFLKDMQPKRYRSVKEVRANAYASLVDKCGTFVHLPSQEQSSKTALGVYALGLMLKADCPENDCRLYLNIFKTCQELDESINYVEGWPRKVLEMELSRNYIRLVPMFTMNYAIREYRKSKKKEELPTNGVTPLAKIIQQRAKQYLDKNPIPYTLSIDRGD